MKQNKGFTLVELIIVLACLTGVLGFFWKILESSSKDAYTINEKMEVQNSVTSLMNAIQKDTQEAKIMFISAENTYAIFVADESNSDKIYEDKEYEFGEESNKKIYEFDAANKTVTRTNTVGEITTVGTYDNIIGFSLKPIVNKSKYGVEVDIIGGKKDYDSAEIDKSKYTLNSTFFTRNTYINNN